MAEEQTTLIRLPEGVTVGDRMEVARVAAGLTPKQMARRLGVSRKTYLRLIRGERALRLSEIYALAAITGQDVAFFGASSDEGPRSVPHPLPGSQPVNGDQDEIEPAEALSQEESAPRPE